MLPYRGLLGRAAETIGALWEAVGACRAAVAPGSFKVASEAVGMGTLILLPGQALPIVVTERSICSFPGIFGWWLGVVFVEHPQILRRWHQIETGRQTMVFHRKDTPLLKRHH